MDTYTKEHSAEYQAQAWIDLARKLHGEHPEVTDPANVASVLIKPSHHTHYVIGSGANDPQKYDPGEPGDAGPLDPVHLHGGAAGRRLAPRRFLRPGTCPPRHRGTLAQVTTVEDPEWTRRYHSLDIAEKAFGGSVEITLTDGTVITDEIAVADAHPLGARPFAREQYVNKFRTLAAGLVADEEIERFLDAARLPGTGRRRPGPAEHHRPTA